MRIKRVSELSPGDVVGADVHGAQRALLCRKATTLDAETIELLLRRGVPTVMVDEPSESMPVEELSDERRVAVEASVAARFGLVPTNPRSHALRQAAIRGLQSVPADPTPAPPDPSMSLRSSAVALGRMDIATVVDRVEELPTFSGIYERISTLTAKGDASAAELGRVIEDDEALALRVLGVARSALQSRSIPVSSVSQAVVHLGFRTIGSLVLSSSAVKALAVFAAPGFTPLWRHSFAVALAAKHLSAQLGLGDPEQAFTMGLVHDIGKFVLMAQFKQRYSTLGQSATANQRMVDIEHDRLGVDHRQVGYIVARRWGVPERMVVATYRHHDPERVKDGFAEVALVAIADAIANALGLGLEGAPVEVPGPKCWDALKVTQECLDLVCYETLRETSEFRDFHAVATRPFSSMAPRARTSMP